MSNNSYFFKIISKDLSSPSPLIEVVFYLQGEKIFHNQLRLNDTKSELEQMENVYKKKGFFAGYPFICSCGDGECTGIFLELEGSRVYFATNLIEKGWDFESRENVGNFIRDLIEFFAGEEKDLRSFKQF